MPVRSKTLLILILSIFFLAGCNAAEQLGANRESNSNSTQKADTNSQPPTEVSKDGTIPSGTGTAKEVPAPGTGNVQGKALFNEQPAVGVEVKLCKTFNRFAGGCTGEMFTTKTDENGEYLIKNVTPGIYEGLTVQVFNTPYYIFNTSGIISAAKYNIEADKTYFASDTHLYKNDLKLTSPKAGAKVAAGAIEVKWDPYTDAAYYKLSIHGDSSSGAETPSDYIGRRVDDTSIVLDKPLKPGSYRPKVEAFNASDRKLAQSADDIKFSVN